MNFVYLPAIIMATPVVIMAHNVFEVRNWRKVPGVVVSTDVVPMRYKGSPARSFRPVIRYRYIVDGVEHHSDVYEHGSQTGGSEPWARAILVRYPPGAQITVLHDPLEPGRACITVRFGFFGWVLTVLSLLLFWFASSV